MSSLSCYNLWDSCVSQHFQTKPFSQNVTKTTKHGAIRWQLPAEQSEICDGMKKKFICVNCESGKGARQEARFVANCVWNLSPQPFPWQPETGDISSDDECVFRSWEYYVIQRDCRVEHRCTIWAERAESSVMFISYYIRCGCKVASYL